PGADQGRAGHARLCRQAAGAQPRRSPQGRDAGRSLARADRDGARRPMTPPAVVVEELSHRFGSTTALEAISLRVDEAELFGLVGLDGGGKTTLFRILATLLVPPPGRATVLRADVVRDLWRLRARVGRVP